MKFRLGLVAILFCFVLSSNAIAKSFPTASPESVGMSSQRLMRIDEALKADIKAGKIPAASVLIYRRGKVVYHKNFGTMDKDKKVPLRNDTIYRIYSMTKPLTSTAIMMLFEEGKLLLSDPVAKYIPEFKEMQVTSFKKDASGKEILEKAKSPITIQQLLTHTSGLIYFFYVPNEFRKPHLAAAYGGKTIAQVAKKTATLPLAYQPGTKYLYSNSFSILGRVVEVASGMSFDQYLEKSLFQPLGMVDTGFNVKKSKLNRLIYQGPKAVFAQDFSKPVTMFEGGGGAVSTTMDYARFAIMLLNGGKLDGKQLLSPKTVAYMSSDHLGPLYNPGGLGYLPGPGYGSGFGFYVRTHAGTSSFLGNVGEFFKGGAHGTVFWVDPKEELAAVAMTASFAQRNYFRWLLKNLIYQAIVD
jgi:CubicO group peptidase (beta-lactamase class C family)